MPELAPVPLDSLPPRERILRTAHDLFYAQGTHAVGVDLIIARSRVSKVTFYRQFPSKHALILAYLTLRHEVWMDWFDQRLTQARHGQLAADRLADTLLEWFTEHHYRGCAFINSACESAPLQADIQALVQQHKRAMTERIARLVGPEQAGVADMLGLLVDGAIVHAQFEANPAQTAHTLRRALSVLLARACAPNDAAPPAQTKQTPH
ncbi:TetR/AcrR family transcriptional regulator [Alcaligenes sp. SDU_A2]|uniref:TetR/AcrR family transcriptional regulator n=1 Tax=Alcaligenes sp. SDU_A2 TaxID=3136634 RepID=UPI002CA04674|nr:TetR/AcrR family transcriptional regulator [Alcaligenes sp.]HRL26871.1 TetR/AcrR family transcriptional regulator [Alcaligenes sp.]